MELVDWEHRVLLFSIFCHGILLWRLLSQRLAGLYVFLTIFLSAEALESIALYPVGNRNHSTLYGWIFLIFTPLIWVVAYLVVLELYRLILEDYPGISSVGQNAVSWCMGLAALVSVLYAIPDLRTTTGRFPVLHIYAIMERSTVLGLLLFLVLIQLFLFHYKLRLSRNRMVYATGYAVYFGIGVAQDILWIPLGARFGEYLSLWIVAAAGVILLVGGGLLSQAGEVRVELQPVDEDSDRVRLQKQLTEMNRLLTRAARGRG